MATELDKVNNGALATLIAVVALGVIGVAWAVTALTRQQMSAHAFEKEGSAQAERNALSQSQKAALEQGMPIEAAMQAVVRELAKNPQSASPPPSAAPAAAAVGGTGGSGGGAAGAGGVSGARAGTGGSAAAPTPAAAGGASPRPTLPATPKPPPSAPPAAPNHGP